MSIDNGLDEIELQEGRPEPYPWTNLNDWVAVSGVSSIAAHIYWIMRGHLYHVRGDVAVNKLTMDTIAAMLGKSRGDKITRYVDELVTIGAVSKNLVGMPARNVYKVHKVPPPGYSGPVSFAEWHKIRKALAQLSAVTPKRGEQADADAGETANQQVTPVAPVRGQQDAPEQGQQAKPQVSADTPDRGEQGPVNPKRGEQDHPERGHKEVVGVLAVVKTPPLPPDGDQPAAAAVVEATTGGGEDSPPQPQPDTSEALRAIVDDIRATRPGWKPAAIRKALEAAAAAGWTPKHAVDALTALALDQDGSRYGHTGSPSRLTAYEGGWWADTAPRPPAAPVVPPAPRGPACGRHWGEPADGCPLCPLDNAPPADPMPAGAGRELARQTAAAVARKATVSA